MDAFEVCGGGVAHLCFFGGTSVINEEMEGSEGKLVRVDEYDFLALLFLFDLSAMLNLSSIFVNIFEKVVDLFDGQEGCRGGWKDDRGGGVTGAWNETIYYYWNDGKHMHGRKESEMEIRE